MIQVQNGDGSWPHENIPDFKTTAGEYIEPFGPGIARGTKMVKINRDVKQGEILIRSDIVRLRKSKVAGKGIEGSIVVIVSCLVVAGLNKAGIELGETENGALVVVLVGAISAVKNWWKHR